MAKTSSNGTRHARQQGGAFDERGPGHTGTGDVVRRPNSPVPAPPPWSDNDTSVAGEEDPGAALDLPDVNM